MIVKKLIIIYITLLVLASSISLPAVSQKGDPPEWDKDWKSWQEIIMPISTENEHAKYQPIDIEVEFKNECWGKSEKENSIRVVVWDGEKWNELESQVYDITESKPNFIEKCGVVFLIPEFADGNERYFVYYDASEKKLTSYTDHVSIEDAYYYYEPIPGISVEGDYYKITEGDYTIYGIGQKGKVIYRKLSNTIIKMKPKSKDFSILNAENTLSLCFTYYEGPEEKNEISSDQKLVSKEILVDGNLMLEFKIVSESYDGNLRTSNVYKYYYCPTENKKISVHIEHQVFEPCTVKGVFNTDGRYGGIVSFQSKSERIEKMRFGEILPYLHVYGEDDNIKQYQLNVDPEDTSREEVVPYSDDCDIGKEPWLSYDEGDSGRAHGIIFSSNEEIVKSGKDENDGIQVKVTEREFMDALGAEIDYAAINFGRNSYEKNGKQDLEIPGDLVVEFDVEYFSSLSGGYHTVPEEAKIFPSLIKHRHEHESDSNGGEQNIYTLKVTPRFFGRILSFPLWSKIIGLNVSVVYAELYRNEELVSLADTTSTIVGAPRIIFSKLVKGEYLLKIYRRNYNERVNLIGFDKVLIEDDTSIDIWCTWSKEIIVSIYDQNSKKLENVELMIYRNSTFVESNTTDGKTDVVFRVPFSIYPYILNASYKGFKIYEEELPILPPLKKEVGISLELFDITINIFDKLDFPPGFDIKPTLTSKDMYKTYEILPEESINGKYLFEKLPASTYTLHISYGSYSEDYEIVIPDESAELEFSFDAEYRLETSIYDSRGNPIDCSDKTISIARNKKIVIESASVDEKVNLPPGEYTIRIFNNNKLIGLKNIVLSNDRKIKIATTVNPIYPSMILVLVSIFIIQIIVLLFFKKISFNSFMKLVAMSLILISLVLPWWSLNGENAANSAQRNIKLFLVPSAMIESTHFSNSIYRDIANIPEIFTNFLESLLLIIYSGFALIGFSFVPNILYRRRFYRILISASIIFLFLVAGAFTFGMGQIAELSLGGLQCSGILQVSLPDKSVVYMQLSWGLGLGFYLCIIAALAAFTGGMVDYLKKKRIIKKNTT